jgi:hypothetical protein
VNRTTITSFIAGSILAAGILTAGTALAQQDGRSQPAGDVASSFEHAGADSLNLERDEQRTETEGKQVVRDISNLRKLSPEVYKRLIQEMAQDISRQMAKHEQRLREIRRELR